MLCFWQCVFRELNVFGEVKSHGCYEYVCDHLTNKEAVIAHQRRLGHHNYMRIPLKIAMSCLIWGILRQQTNLRLVSFIHNILANIDNKRLHSPEFSEKERDASKRGCVINWTISVPFRFIGTSGTYTANVAVQYCCATYTLSNFENRLDVTSDRLRTSGE